MYLLYLDEWTNQSAAATGRGPGMGAHYRWRGGGGGDRETPTTTDNRLSCFRKHMHAQTHENSHPTRAHHYNPAAFPPTTTTTSTIYPKARPPDLVSHCSFGELSKPSFTVKRHERHLTLSLSW